MGFGYVGYVWALIGCAGTLLLFGSTGTLLYLVGRRMERRGGARAVVESIPLEDRRPSPPDAA